MHASAVVIEYRWKRLAWSRNSLEDHVHVHNLVFLVPSEFAIMQRVCVQRSCVVKCEIYEVQRASGSSLVI